MRTSLHASKASLRVDVLRGLAALFVTLFHVRTELWVGWRAMQASPGAFSTLDHTLGWLGIPMRFMGAGVLLFFVISGYCIHRPQATAGRRQAAGGGRGEAENGNQKAESGSQKAECGRRETGLDWGLFYVRRFLRIAPPYWVALVLSAGVLAMTSGISEGGWERVLSSALMVQNYWGAGGQVASNPSLWSLPVELELYLVYPLAWWLGERLGWGGMFLVSVLVSAGAQAAAAQGAGWLDGCFLKFWALWCAGAWVAERGARDRLPVWGFGCGMALIVLGMAAILSEVTTGWGFASLWLWGGVSVLALLWAVSPRAGNASRGSWLTGGLAWLGTISYSLYLIHYPLFQGAGYLWQRAYGGKPGSLGVALAAVALVIPLAWGFHRLVEGPSHRLARRLGGKAES